MQAAATLLLVVALCLEVPRIAGLNGRGRAPELPQVPLHPRCVRHEGQGAEPPDEATAALCQQLARTWAALNGEGPPLPPDPFFGPSAPAQIHLAMTASRSVYKVSWATNSSFSRPRNTTFNHGVQELCPGWSSSTAKVPAGWQHSDCPAIAGELPYVRYGTAPHNLSELSSGVKTTYRRADMCGYPAAALPGDPRLGDRTGDGLGSGWENPGTLYEVDMVGLRPGVTYFYSVGDLWNGFSPVKSFRCSDATERGEVRWVHYGDMGTLGSA
jgi:hypothetical protein